MLRLRLVEGGRQRKLLIHIGCPPGIRTPICCSRGSCPTIERGGNAANKKPVDFPGLSILKAGPAPVNVTRAGWSSLRQLERLLHPVCKAGCGKREAPVSNDIPYCDVHRFANQHRRWHVAATIFERLRRNSSGFETRL